MEFDINKRENLSTQMRSGIAQLMQYALLDEIIASGGWKGGDIVFQGGTSLHVVHGSPRFSEDLDFMIDVNESHGVEKAMRKAEEALKRRLCLAIPNSELRSKMGGGNPGELRQVLRFDTIWSHPVKNGNVRVRAEFFTVERSHIDSYRRENRRQRLNSALMYRPELSAFDSGSLAIHSLIPAATSESIYGDKMVALAKREYIKPRDFYDLWWLSNTVGMRPDDDTLYSAMRRSADCYTYSDSDISDGLLRLLEQPPELARTIEENLAMFLPADLHRKFLASGAYDEMYNHVMEEAKRLNSVIRLTIPYSASV